MLINSPRRKIHIAQRRSNTSPEPRAGEPSASYAPIQLSQPIEYQPRPAPRRVRSPVQEYRTSPEEGRVLGQPSGHSDSTSAILTSTFKNEEEWETSAEPFKASDGSAKWRASDIHRI